MYFTLLVFARGRPSKGRPTREIFTLPPSQISFMVAHYSAFYSVKRVPRGWSAGPIGSETPSFLETVQRNSKELPSKSVTQTGRKGVRRRHRLDLAGYFQRKLRSLTFSTCTIKRSAPGFMSRHVVNTHHIQFPSGLLLESSEMRHLRLR